MGCCCSCQNDAHARGQWQAQQEDLVARSSIGAPPPYEEASSLKIQESDDVISTQTPPVFPKDTKILPTRIGVRSADHRLYCAAAGGHIEEVKRLLESGFNPSERTYCDWCPLHWAANNDLTHGIEIVKLLVQYGADVNQVSDTGKTPLDMAREAKKSEIGVFLERCGGKTGDEVRRGGNEWLWSESA